MLVTTFNHTQGKGWNTPLDSSMDSEQTLVVAFGSTSLLDDHGPLDELRSTFPNSHLVGCSTSGEIIGTTIQDDSLVVAVARFEHTRLRSGAHRLASADDSFDAGRALAEQLNGPDLKGVLLLSKGLDVNGSDLVRGFNAALPENVIVTGGLAGDGDRFERTWVLSDGKPVSDHISAVAFYGSQVHIGHGSKGGWDIFGPERKVTRSENNVLYELDDKPALDLYKEYLGDLAEGLPASGLRFPLALRADRNDEKQLVRTILAVDEETKSMTFAGDIPEGYLAQLMRANFDHLIDGAEDAALMTRNRGGDGSTTLAIAISCVGRRIVLGERTEEEVEATMDILPKNTYQVGFYSYGELSPYASGSCDLHNQTMTLTTLHET